MSLNAIIYAVKFEQCVTVFPPKFTKLLRPTSSSFMLSVIWFTDICLRRKCATNRVATHLENLEESGNLRVVREKSGKMCCIASSACMKFGQLVLRKIIEIVATRCQILWLKWTKIDLGWGSTTDPSVGAYSAAPDSVAGFKGGYF